MNDEKKKKRETPTRDDVTEVMFERLLSSLNAHAETVQAARELETYHFNTAQALAHHRQTITQLFSEICSVYDLPIQVDSVVADVFDPTYRERMRQREIGLMKMQELLDSVNGLKLQFPPGE